MRKHAEYIADHTTKFETHREEFVGVYGRSDATNSRVEKLEIQVQHLHDKQTEDRHKIVTLEGWSEQAQTTMRLIHEKLEGLLVQAAAFKA